MVAQPAAALSTFRQRLTSHVHTGSDTCPWCEQVIPPEKLEEISGRIAAREREQTLAITSRIEQQHALDKAEAAAKAKADLEVERQQSAAREAAAREDERQVAAAASAEQLAEAARSRQEMHDSLQQQVAAAETARIAAEQTGAAARVQLQQQLQNSEAALAAAKAEAAAREEEIRTEANLVAQAAAAEKLAAAEAARQQAEETLQTKTSEIEATKAAAEQQAITLREQLAELKNTKDIEITQIKEATAADALRVAKEATEAAEAAARNKIAEKDQAVVDAQAKCAEVEGKLAALTEQQQVTLKQELDAQREILEKTKDDAVNAANAKAFEETQRLQNKLNEMQRALDKKTAEELGEGAEIILFEALKKEFPDDRIDRIGRGKPGADILHTVMLNGEACGTIIYDSKNHKAFRSEHVAKLKIDQLAAKAEHAILSTHKFPEGASQLDIRDGVLLANPARVVMVASLFRQQLRVVHTLRLSGIERESKTAALYDFITSERCTQLLVRVDARADELLAQQATEIKWHENNWKKQGGAIRAIQKAKGDLTNEIDLIIGATTASDTSLEASGS